MMTTTIDTKFSEAFATFYAGCQKICAESHKAHGFTFKQDEFRFEEGLRYVKVIQGTGVFCFVDKTNGDVLKPANWKAPAKHARGNIFNANNGLANITPYGPAYLR